MNTKKAVVFDVGRVLIDFSFDNFETFLVKSGANISSRNEFFEATNLFAFERGEIQSEEFISSIQQLLSVSCSSQEIVHEWTKIFTPIKEMLKFCSVIRNCAQTFILSNTNELHWKYLDRNYQVSSITSRAITSFESKVMKPDVKIYETLAKHLNPKTEDILFIDDLLENTLTANSIGWKTIHHQDIQTTKHEVDRFLKF